MRMLDLDDDKKLNRLILYLTKSEAKELRTSLDYIIEDPKQHHHEHIPSEDYQKEITICIYDEKNLEGFDERSKKLILEDE